MTSLRSSQGFSEITGKYLNKIELKSGLSGKCYLPKLTDREKSYYRVTENKEKMRTYGKEEQLQARYHGEYTPGAYDVQRIANLNKSRSKHGLEPLRLSRYSNGPLSR